MHLVARSRFADLCIAAAASLVALAFAAWVVSIATIKDLSGAIFILFVLLWVAAPYLALAIATLVLSSSWISRVLLAVALVASALFGLWAYDFIDEDAQGALLVIFVPLYQGGGVFLAIVFVGIAELVTRRRRAANKGGTGGEDE